MKFLGSENSNGTEMTQIPQFDLKQLRYFRVAAEQGSISAAAVVLEIAPATLSESMAKLEKKLGIQLAIRGRRGLTLTPAGKALAAQIPVLFEAALAVEQATRTASNSRTGPVTLALPPSLSVLIGVPMNETVRSEFPEISLRISDGLSGDIINWIADGNVDLGFVYEEPDLSNFDARFIFTEELFLIAAPDYFPNEVRELDAPTLTFEELGAVPLVLPSARHNARRILERFARNKEITLRIVSEVDSYSQILEMTERASACTLLPRAAVLPRLQDGSLLAVRIADGALTRNCFAVSKRKPVRKAVFDVVWKIALQIIHEMDQRFDLELSYSTTIQKAEEL